MVRLPLSTAALIVLLCATPRTALATPFELIVPRAVTVHMNNQPNGPVHLSGLLVAGDLPIDIPGNTLGLVGTLDTDNTNLIERWTTFRVPYTEADVAQRIQPHQVIAPLTAIPAALLHLMRAPEVLIHSPQNLGFSTRFAYADRSVLGTTQRINVAFGHGSDLVQFLIDVTFVDGSLGGQGSVIEITEAQRVASAFSPTYDPTIHTVGHVPEPGTLALFGIGALAASFRRLWSRT